MAAIPRARRLWTTLKPDMGAGSSSGDYSALSRGAADVVGNAQEAGESVSNGRSTKPRVKKWHTKSMGGCKSCRVRRVKCSEERPKCAACVRRNDECHYPQTPAKGAMNSVRIPQARESSQSSVYSPDSNTEAGPSSFAAPWPVSPGYQQTNITSLISIPPSPDDLLPFFPVTEQRYLFHHYLKESVHNFLILPAPALGNPWVTLHARLALRSPSGTNIFEQALRKAIFAFASFEIGYRISGSGFLMDESGQPQENSFVLQSRAQREESLGLLTQALAPGKSTADDFDTAIAACLSLITLDRFSAGTDWSRPLSLAVSLITICGGPKAFVAGRDTPTRRFLCEQITCFDVVGAYIKDEQPKLLEAWDDWWYDDLPADVADSVPGGFGVDRGVMEYLSRVARVNASAQGLYSIAPDVRKLSLLETGDAPPDVGVPNLLHLRLNIEKEVQQLVLEAPYWQSPANVHSHPRVTLGNMLMSHATTIHLLWTTLGVSHADPRIAASVTAILDLVEQAIVEGPGCRGLLTALAQAAFTASGAERLRARELLQKLEPMHRRDLTRNQILVDLVWEALDQGNNPAEDWQGFVFSLGLSTLTF